ncbi:NAD-dependent protein deacylase Sirt4-like [Planococcus citri]|uniref:NAD-dependent protein deacylase Sirt4-like n=1 Tax=Planococcus citri TaxID=170843 RepID=UPI0031F93C0E
MINFRSKISHYDIPSLGNVLSSISRTICYVPAHHPVNQSDIGKLREFLLSHKSKTLVITGAGVSTESGIPDYRSKDVGLFARSNHKPMTYQKFIESDAGRRRYWARSYVGWSSYSKISPNSVHRALKKLEDDDFISTIITQNVDNLHKKCGSRNVIELHGTLFQVICLSCQNSLDRFEFQKMLESLNPKFNVTPSMIRPDGDVDLPEEFVLSFNIPSCPKCDGILKPDVVFFGENVPLHRVKHIQRVVESSTAVLVLGSTLETFSSYRIILQARDLKVPVYMINIGPTRADNLATFKVSAKCGEVFEHLLPKLQL